MCGIVGYIGPKKVVPLILDGLRRLEYRGYDSAGIAVVNADGKVEIRRAPGKLHNLEEVIRRSPMDGTYGIGHTRWATHGRPTEENAHPHRDCTGQIVVVHNGIVENYVELKQQLQSEGHKFVTETDTEIIAHLVEKHMKDGGPLEDAVRKTVRQLTGVYSVAILSAADPNKIVAARNGPPSVIGLGQGECFVASDIPAILAHTREMFFLADGDIAVLTPQGVRVMNLDGDTVERAVQHISWDPIMAEKGGFKHFMQKEIFEQPRAVRDTLLANVALDSAKVFLAKMDITEREFRDFTNIKIVACGTSWHAGQTGKFMIEQLAKIPVEVDYGSEFRYRDPIIDSKTLTICISQSGETADTLAAQREAKSKGSKTLAICNVFGSMITREAAGTILTHAGPEIGVASTKAFTGQLAALMLTAMYLGQVRGVLAEDRAKYLLQEFMRIPQKMETVLQGDEEGIYENLARQFFRHTNFLYLGRGIHFPIALEGALKLKEISYIHAEGYPAGEMKHGPNALIDENLPVVMLATRDESNPEAMTRYEKSVSNIKEVKARDGIVISVVTEGDELAREASDYIIVVPPAIEILAPLLEVIPLQLLAYHIAVRRGCDVDQPRNLAKSVTVE
ncbi:MAG TPA: glutamine--fructose-6-phosphate transaminase (isomerizing) [Candidatus Dormibacteraeota bacterium]|nr:glutamine--fructose-6-phosphate transaminase (isomerizing) [Candidatus Dormibacteraeota bacterium]